MRRPKEERGEQPQVEGGARVPGPPKPTQGKVRAQQPELRPGKRPAGPDLEPKQTTQEVGGAELNRVGGAAAPLPVHETTRGSSPLRPKIRKMLFPGLEK